MFFQPSVLAKKGPLSVAWLAAHFEKKLTKQQILKADINELIEILLNSDLKFSLRITSDLMMGVCYLNYRKIKYFLADTQELEKTVKSLIGKKKASKKKPAQTIDFSDVGEFINLTIPEIFEIADLITDPADPSILSSDEISRLEAAARKVTLVEIPPLTFEESLEEQERQLRLDDFGEGSIIDEMDENFKDFFKPSPPSKMIATSSDQNLGPNADVQSPPPAESPIIDLPEIGNIDLPETPESIEKTRRAALDSLKKSSLELPRLDESSIASTKGKKAVKKGKRRGLIIDAVIEIPDKTMQKAMNNEDYETNKIVPNIFIPTRRLVESHESLLTKPERPLPKILQKYFPAASKFRKHQHFEEEESLASSHHEADDFFDSNLPPAELGSPSGQDQSAPEMIDDYEDQLPMARARTAAEMGDADHGFGDLPEFSITERTTIEERFNNSLQDMLAQTDPIQFDQLSLVDNKKSTAALYFCNLLEMKNNQIIDMDQVPSLERFNPINIKQIEKSESI